MAGERCTPTVGVACDKPCTYSSLAAALAPSPTWQLAPAGFVPQEAFSLGHDGLEHVKFVAVDDAAGSNGWLCAELKQGLGRGTG
jgi:hypothetical protein